MVYEEELYMIRLSEIIGSVTVPMNPHVRLLVDQSYDRSVDWSVGLS